MSQLDALGTYSYCSQGNAIWSQQHIRDNASVEAILDILAKQVLCRHDVENINSLYRTIKAENKNDRIDGLLKKKIEELHRETFKVQNRIFQEANRLGGKVLRQVNWKQILKDSDYSVHSRSDYAASALISLYQLQKLEAKGVSVAHRFLEGHDGFLNNNPQHIDLLATLLPCCYSGQHFEEDRRALLGNSPEKSACEIADRSLNHMLEATFLKEEIEVKKSQLAQEQYPAYFAQLLDKGYLKLFVYLKDIWNFHEDAKGKGDYIKAMPFSQVSQVILETQHAIMQSVEEAITSFSSAKQVVFLVGVTGTGKSTTFCYLRGDTMRRDGDLFQSEQGPNLIFKGSKSGTFFPNTALVEDMLLVDFPGFDDTNDLCVALGVEMALKALVKRYSAKLLVLGELIAVKPGRAEAIDQLRRRLSRLFQNFADCVVGITKYSLDNDFIEITHQQEKIRHEEERLQKERLKEEERLQKDIKGLEAAYRATNDSTVQGMLSDKQKLLQELQAAHYHPSLFIQECKEKIAARQVELSKSEETLLNRLGRPSANSHVIRFEDVSDPQPRERQLATLREARTITVEASNSMDATHSAYLRTRFKEQLKLELLASDDYDLEQGTVEAQTFILTSSFINYLTITTHPEIGQFLHSPEINTEFVDEFDRDIVQTCSEHWIKRLVLSLDLPDYRLLLKDPSVKKEVDKQKRQIVEERVEDLYKTLVSPESHDSLESTEEAFERLQKRYFNGNKLQSNLTAATFTHWPEFNWIRHFVGVSIDYVSEVFQKRKASNQFFDALIDQLRKAQLAISSLRQLADLVERRRDMARIFQSMDMENWQEKEWGEIIRTKIDAIGSLYGNEKWEERTTDLRHHCPKYDAEQRLHLLGTICMLLNDHIRFVVIENNEMLPALEAKAQQHHYRFFVKIEDSRAVILVDQNHYPLMIFDIIVESLKKEPENASTLADLVQACTGKSIVKGSIENAQLVVSRTEEFMKQIADTIHEEISHNQNEMATTMTMSMTQLVALTRLKLEHDSLEKYLISNPDSLWQKSICSAMDKIGAARYSYSSYKSATTFLAQLLGSVPAAPSSLEKFIGQTLTRIPVIETVEILGNHDRKLGRLLNQLAQLMDMTIFDEITQFASDFLQMDVNMPLFRALLADVYSEQAGLKKS